MSEVLTSTATIKSRIIHKHDTEENWNKATNFYPRLGEIIVYDPDDTHANPRYKTGIWDGVSPKTEDMLVVNLPFTLDANLPVYTVEYDASAECLNFTINN